MAAKIRISFPHGGICGAYVLPDGSAWYNTNFREGKRTQPHYLVRDRI
jgi:hypothetical protein